MSTVDTVRRSPLASYQDLVVGSRSWTALLHHEVVASWGAALPGALGVGFRRAVWPSLFAHMGRTVWGRNVTLRHPRRMWIGDALIDDDCLLDARGCAEGEFRIEDGALVSRGCIVSGKDGPLALGPRVSLGAYCVLYASTRLEIGADTLIAAQCYIGGGRYTARGRLDLPIVQQPEPRLGVVIEEGCWLGAGAAVIDGVRVGKGSVVAAGAVVTRDVPAFSVAAGVPARVVARRDDTQAERP